jgi:cell division control protein 6
MEDSVFQPYLRAQTIFKPARDVLSPAYIPDRLPHREKQIDHLASILATSLRGDRPSNVMIFGKTGTGKTAVVKYLGNEIRKVDAAGKVEYFYINCEIVDTPYSVMQTIGNRLASGEERIPFTGLSLERVYGLLVERLEAGGRVAIIVLDEIDKLVAKSGDDVLYHLTKINDDLGRAKLSVIGISNDLKFTENLDPRVVSRLCDEKLVFPPYNAEELLDILTQRAQLALEERAIGEGVLAYIAALAAQEHGDARRALELLRVAAEIAQRRADDIITERHVQQGKNKLELDCVIEAVKSLPTQSKLILMGILLQEGQGNSQLTTGEVYDIYRQLCRRAGMTILTQRRVTDLISELDMLGLVNAQVKSYGRGGRTKEIQASVPSLEVRQTLERDDALAGARHFRPKFTSPLDIFDDRRELRLT